MQSKKTMTRVDEQDPNTFVVCLECNTKHPQITHTHLKKAHNMTLDEYASKHKIDKTQLYCVNVRKLRSVTLENMIAKYGEEDGLIRWNQYKAKQAYSNSFEYKQEKRGWTKEQYDAYNDSRACTKENFVKRHGKKEGNKRWNNYCERQSYAGVAEEYFIEKFGAESGKQKYIDVCNSKSHTKESFVKRYGQELGLQKWQSWSADINSFGRQSKIALEMFDAILERLPTEKHEYIYFDSKNYEYTFVCSTHRPLFVDFYDATTRRVIEFAGDYWHGNPDVFEESYYNLIACKTAKELYDKTLERNKILEEVHGCKVLLVWENEYMKNKEETLGKCLKFLNE